MFTILVFGEEDDDKTKTIKCVHRTTTWLSLGVYASGAVMAFSIYVECVRECAGWEVIKQYWQ